MGTHTHLLSRGLGKMRAHWKNLSPEIHDSLLGQLSSIGAMSGQSLSMTVIGLSKLGATWDSLTPKCRLTLQRGFPSPIQSSEQIVANVIHSFGIMGVKYAENLDDETKGKIANSFITVASTFTGQGLSNTMYGWAKMGYRFEQWPHNLHFEWESAFFSSRSPCSISRMKDQSVSNSIWSLGQCGAAWASQSISFPTAGRYMLTSNFCSIICRSIESNFEQMTEQGLSNTLMGLAKVYRDTPLNVYPILYALIIYPIVCLFCML